jgi:hypothetical protein
MAAVCSLTRERAGQLLMSLEPAELATGAGIFGDKEMD